MNPEEFPRVSEILDTVDWGIKKVPRFILNKYGKHGTAVHAAVHNKLIGKRTRVVTTIKNKVDVILEWAKGRKLFGSEIPVCGKLAGVDFRGTVDAIFKNEDSYLLVDWKTGRMTKRHFLQANFYLVAARQTFGEMSGKPLTAKLVKPVNDDIVHIEEYDVPDCVQQCISVLDIYSWLKS